MSPFLEKKSKEISTLIFVKIFRSINWTKNQQSSKKSTNRMSCDP
jgi:hypothetical protein